MLIEFKKNKGGNEAGEMLSEMLATQQYQVPSTHVSQARSPSVTQLVGAGRSRSLDLTGQLF